MIVTRFINRFLEIFWFGQIDPFGNVKLFDRYMKLILMIFPKKMLVCGKWTILDPKMVHPHTSGFALRVFLKFLHNELG